MAADWNFYGSARFATFYVHDDYDVNKSDGFKYDDDDDIQWQQNGNSRIGANVKFNDQIGGGFEMGNTFNKRKLFGTYTFGGGSQLLIGQTYTPTALFYSNSVFDGDGDLLGIGEFYEGRVPMIQWKMGGFKLALIEPTENGVGDAVTDVDIPKIEAAYAFKGDTFFVDVFGGYQTYTWDSAAPNGSDLDFDSYIFGGGGGANFGAFFVKAGGHYGQNVGNYGAYVPDWMNGNNDGMPAFTTGAVIVGDNTKDTDNWGFLAVLGWELNDMYTFEAGYGYENYDSDAKDIESEDAWQVYLNATVNIAPNFFIVPEIGYIETDPNHKGEPKDPNPSKFYVGAKWQINF